MCKAFIDLDIKEAIFSIPTNKSPRPDGFNSGFYKTTWQKLGALVYSAIRERKRRKHIYSMFCNYATVIWNDLRQWWRYTPEVQNSSQLLRNLKHSKGPRTLKQITSAIITATFYYIAAYQTAYLIKDKVRSIILFLSACSKKFSSYIDNILT
ncbi:hypothetical protein Cgig2_026578 [Carnegiea gigantea]|uniref:Uncharacterized protein n=1 Tax=Carnegiea gigantea TaxID=171969 RepID=A0A9Q1JZP0_9CARY|nr:hypothetical protein Cgig2_026578 [Carnegiea gigantea]